MFITKISPLMFFEAPVQIIHLKMFSTVVVCCIYLTILHVLTNVSIEANSWNPAQTALGGLHCLVK